MVCKRKIEKIAITMTLTTVVYYKQEEFKTSLQYCKIEQTKCARETNSYRFVHIFIDN